MTLITSLLFLSIVLISSADLVYSSLEVTKNKPLFDCIAIVSLEMYLIYSTSPESDAIHSSIALSSVFIVHINTSRIRVRNERH